VGVATSRTLACTSPRDPDHEPEQLKRKYNADTAECLPTTPTIDMLERRQKAWYAKLTTWEKVYLAAGAAGGGIYVYATVDWDGSKAAAKEVRSRNICGIP